MKKLFFIFLMLIFASSASATVYRWVDEKGVTNFSDDYSKVPPRFQNKVEEMSMPKTRPSSSSATSGKTIVGARSGETATQAPPVGQNLIREGEFAVKLVEALRIGRAKNEAEAESILTSAGIAPKNGWIADYPMTPDIIGELESAVGEAADARRLSMPKNEALKAFRTTAVEFELPIVAEIPEEYTETPPPTAPEYTEPSVVDDYYYAEGPPVITYYPPPWDYYYMYAWIPTPFWYSGFYFPGFFILNDFHRVCHHGDGGHYGHGHDPYTVTNHVRDPRTGSVHTIDPARRHAGMISGSTATPSVKGYNSTEARNSARSIFERSRKRVASNAASVPMTGRDNRNPAYSQSRRGNEKQVYNRQSNTPGFNNRNGSNGGPPVNGPRISRTPGQTGTHGYGRTYSGQSQSFHPPSSQGSGRSFSLPQSMNRQNGINAQRPSTGQAPSSHLPSQGGGSQHYGSFSGGSGGFSRSHQGGGSFSGSHQGGGGGSSGSHQGGGSSSGFGRGGARF